MTEGSEIAAAEESEEELEKPPEEITIPQIGKIKELSKLTEEAKQNTKKTIIVQRELETLKNLTEEERTPDQTTRLTQLKNELLERRRRQGAFIRRRDLLKKEQEENKLSKLVSEMKPSVIQIEEMRTDLQKLAEDMRDKIKLLRIKDNDADRRLALRLKQLEQLLTTILLQSRKIGPLGRKLE